MSPTEWVKAIFNNCVLIPATGNNIELREGSSYTIELTGLTDDAVAIKMDAFPPLGEDGSCRHCKFLSHGIHRSDYLVIDTRWDKWYAVFLELTQSTLGGKGKSHLTEQFSGSLSVWNFINDIKQKNIGVHFRYVAVSAIGHTVPPKRTRERETHEHPDSFLSYYVGTKKTIHFNQLLGANLN